MDLKYPWVACNTYKNDTGGLRADRDAADRNAALFPTQCTPKMQAGGIVECSSARCSARVPIGQKFLLLHEGPRDNGDTYAIVRHVL